MKNKTIVFIFLSLSMMTVLIFSKQTIIETDQQTFDELEQQVINNVNSDIKELVKREYDFNDFYLLFDEYKINLNDIKPLFNFFDKHTYQYYVKSISPYLNPLYKEKLSNIDDILLEGHNLDNSIKYFYNAYISALEQIHLDSDLEKANTGKIGIRMINVNTSNIAMYQFLKKYDKVKYSLTKTGLFRKI